MNFILYVEVPKPEAEGIKKWRLFVMNTLSTAHVNFLTSAGIRHKLPALLFAVNSPIPLSPRFFIDVLPLFTIKHYCIAFDVDIETLYVFKGGKYLQCEYDNRSLEERYKVIDFPNLPTEKFIQLHKGMKS